MARELTKTEIEVIGNLSREVDKNKHAYWDIMNEYLADSGCVSKQDATIVLDKWVASLCEMHAAFWAL